MKAKEVDTTNISRYDTWGIDKENFEAKRP